MIYVSEYAPAVKDAINSVLDASDIKNFNALARRLDVSKQALSKWRQTGIVPAHRALQMELLSGGKVSWKKICPDIVAEFENASEVIHASSRVG
jgi:DNA-binding transcriptional regulator YdaS (Cro superfamily)